MGGQAQSIAGDNKKICDNNNEMKKILVLRKKRKNIPNPNVKITLYASDLWTSSSNPLTHPISKFAMYDPQRQPRWTDGQSGGVRPI
jgi:hypothetical protein